MAPFRVVLLAVMSTAAFLALAAWGEGGLHRFLAIPQMVALSLVTAALVVASAFTSVNLDAGVREDRANRWVLAAFAVVGLLAAWIPAYCDRNAILTLGGPAVRWAGVGLYGIGGVLRLWPIFALGRRFSGLAAIQRDHQLVTDGIYGVIRHPSYLGLLVILLGWALSFRSLVGLGLAALALIPVLGRIGAEERLLRETFGASYARYAARTWRLIPFVY